MFYTTPHQNRSQCRGHDTLLELVSTPWRVLRDTPPELVYAVVLDATAHRPAYHYITFSQYSLILSYICPSVHPLFQPYINQIIHKPLNQINHSDSTIRALIKSYFKPYNQSSIYPLRYPSAECQPSKSAISATSCTNENIRLFTYFSIIISSSLLVVFV